MGFKKLILVITSIFLLFLLSACSADEDCSSMDSSYIKYGFDSNLKECVVVKEIPKNKCGNLVIEENENFCNCPKDVPETHPTQGCDGVLGDYLTYTCNEKTDTCGLYQNEKVVTETKILTFKNSDLQFEVKLDLNNPFVLNSDDNSKLPIEVSLFNFPNANVKVTDLIIENFAIVNAKNTRLLSYDFNEKLMNINEKTKRVEVPFMDTIKYESKESLKPKLTISYNKNIYDSSGKFLKTESKKEVLVSSLGTWTFINPNFYE